jgi:hypothetical protein
MLALSKSHFSLRGCSLLPPNGVAAATRQMCRGNRHLLLRATFGPFLPRVLKALGSGVTTAGSSRIPSWRSESHANTPSSLRLGRGQCQGAPNFMCRTNHALIQGFERDNPHGRVSETRDNNVLTLADSASNGLTVLAVHGQTAARHHDWTCAVADGVPAGPAVAAAPKSSLGRTSAKRGSMNICRSSTPHHYHP